MKNFTKGILVGVGVGLLVAPIKGEDMRRLLAERAREWRNSLPEDSKINRYASQISERVSSTKENWRDYAQQAVSKAKDTGATFGNKAMQTGQDMATRAKQTGQDMASKAKQTGQDVASKTKQAGQDISGKTKQGVGLSSSDRANTKVMPESEI